jgi:hypothetical protein
MTIDLNHDELELLIQLVNQRFTEIQQRDPKATTPFEVRLFKKLYDARMVEMGITKPNNQSKGQG